MRWRPGESKHVEFPLGFDELNFYNVDVKRTVEPTTYKIWVGGSSLATDGDEPEIGSVGGFGTEGRGLTIQFHVLQQAVETARYLRVPLAPIVAAGFDVKFKTEMEFFQPGGEAAVGLEKRLIVSRGDIHVWRRGRICSLD